MFLRKFLKIVRYKFCKNFFTYLLKISSIIFNIIVHKNVLWWPIFYKNCYEKVTNKIVVEKDYGMFLCPGSTAVEHLPHNP